MHVHLFAVELQFFVLHGFDSALKPFTRFQFDPIEAIALGTGKIDENGKKIDFTVKKGDKVLISKYGGTEIKIDDQNYLIMREDDILGIIG